MEFEESRPYVAGDDVRNLDWKVTARTGQAHTKQYREERERPVFVSVDLRPGMFFATRGRFKSVIASRSAALLAWAAHAQGDRIGGQIITSDQLHEYKPLRGKSGVLHLLKQMTEHSNAIHGVKKTISLRHSLRNLQRIAHPGSLIALIGDFSDLDNDCEQLLSLLSRHCDLILIFIHDPIEKTLPDKGLMRFTDGKNFRTIDSSNRTVNGHHQQYFNEHLHRLENLCKRFRCSLLNCSTQQDPVQAIPSQIHGHG